MTNVIPTGVVSPYLTLRGAAKAIDFYAAAFGAVENYRLVDPADGRIGHAEIRIGSTLIMLADEYPDFGALGPDTIGGSPVRFHISVDDADEAFARAVAAGATPLRPVADQFFGERTGLLLDPFGHSWYVAQPVEALTGAQMQARWDAGFGE